MESYKRQNNSLINIGPATVPYFWFCCDKILLEKF